MTLISKPSDDKCHFFITPMQKKKYVQGAEISKLC